ncbi:MAG: divalent-cation tolerance protein CutA [Actinomycetota bacterium]|nr:divalent-cation tolerance protein CutA [Actinomycetota bacterium]
MADPDVCELCITAPDAEWLAGFTKALLDQRLCACGHLSAPIRSLYRWEGRLYDETEARVALHTRTALVPEILKRTTAEHPYSEPAVFVLPIEGGSRSYLQWIRDETGPR